MAQPVVSLSGTCVNTPLTLSSSQNPLQIVWKKGLVTVQTTNASWSANATMVAGTGVYGGGANQLAGPIWVHVDAAGNVYVCDHDAQRIQKWAPGATTGTTVAGGNGAGAAANQFNYPYGVFADGSGNIYVSDMGNNRVQKWAAGATTGVTVAGGNGGGSAANQFNSPAGVFVDGSGNMYISDYGNSRIQKWAPGATSGTTVAGGNSSGSGANQLYYPAGAYVDGSGNIYIIDQNNNRIQKWAPGATSGTTVAGGTGSGGAANQLNYPAGLYLDGSGNMYIADNGNERIQKWAAGATSGTTVAGGNGSGTAANQFRNPNGLCVDTAGNIYVADFNNNRIQKFSTNTSMTYTPTSAGNYTATVTAFNGTSATTAAFPVSSCTMDPVFVSTSPQSVTLCQGASAVSLNTILTVSDTDASETETWTVTTPPVHGSLSGFSATHASGSVSIVPAGLSYTPQASFFGTDAFTIQVSDGGATASMQVNVTVKASPGISGFGSNPGVHEGTGSASIVYNSSANSPLVYSIAYSSAAHDAGFADVTDASLSPRFINLVLPGGSVSGSFSGTLTVKNSDACISSGYPISVNIGANPGITVGWSLMVPHGTTSGSIAYSAATNSPSTYSIAYNAAAQAAGFVNVYNATLPASSIPIVIPSNATEGSYSGALTVYNGTNSSVLYPVVIRVLGE